QHQAQQRFPLLPPADQQTDPNRHQYASCHWTKNIAKVQNAAPDHSGGNSGVHAQPLVVIILVPAPLRVVNSEQRLRGPDRARNEIEQLVQISCAICRRSLTRIQVSIHKAKLLDHVQAGCSHTVIHQCVRTLSRQHLSKAADAKLLHKPETLIQEDERHRQNDEFYDEPMPAIQHIGDEKRQNGCEEGVARSLEKEIRKRNGEHCRSSSAPEGGALKKYQNPKKRCYGVKEITCKGD